MASFPGAIKSFTTKNTGDVVQAAHVNDIQDEVNAVEGALLGTGTPALSLGGTLSVTGGSTFAATLSVTGGSTFLVRPVTPPPQAAVVYLESTVTLGSSGASTISWLAQNILTNSSMHSTTTNPERLTPQSTGLYQLSATVHFSSTQGGIRTVIIQDSSGETLGQQHMAASSQGNTIFASGYKRFDALGGYGTVRLSLTGQSTCELSTGAGRAYFSLVKL